MPDEQLEAFTEFGYEMTELMLRLTELASTN